MKRTLSMILVGATLSLSLPALAQPDLQKRAAVRRQATDLMMQRLTQELALDAPAQAQVRAIWDRYEAQIEGVRKEQWMAMKELKAQLAAPSPDNARLTQLSDLVFNDRAKVEAHDHQRVGEFRRVLTPVQFAKAIVVSPQIRRQLQQQMMQSLRGQQPSGEETE
ncbi:MAG TPA: periplasmic heavy metal sensor [Polyangia bacterium]